MIGRVVAQYEIVERLGAGGMGEVFKARDRKLNRFVALKVLPTDSRQDDERRQRFLQEARAASALSHPNIITVHDVISDDAADYLVLEFVNGRSLADLIPRGGLPASETLRYSIQISSALAAAHAAGILHRDLKPGNVMVNEHGIAKLLDFGLAKRMDSALASTGEEAETVDQAPRTMAGTILGTASYMSPEQIEGKALDARSDIFSFGLVLYEMLTGQRAFKGDSAITTLTAVLRDQPPSITQLAVETPPQYERIIERCLQKHPGERWQSMADLHAALAGLKEDLDSGRILPSGRHQAITAAALATPPPPPAPKGKPTSRKTPLVAAAAVIVIAVAALGGWFWQRSQSQPAQQQASVPPEPPQPQTSSAPAAGAESAADTAPPAGAAQPALSTAPPAAATAKPAAVNQAARQKPAPKITVIGQTAEPAKPIAAEPVPPPPPVPTPAAPQPVPISVPDGTRLKLSLAADLTAAGQPGDVVRLSTAEELRVNEATVIAKGATVTAVLGEAGRKFIFGRSSKIPILVDTVAATDGQKLRLRATLQPSGSDKSRRQIQVQPAGGKNAEVLLPAGSTLEAFIDGTTDVRAIRRR
ncbi:MAG: serine/threonine protein kinase [Acidobacteria bacterium]|nr:serine/threonine protein kinase [Acidobacteriota bacterium]